MTAPIDATWDDAGQRELVAALDRVRAMLDRHAAGGERTGDSPIARALLESPSPGVDGMPLALDALGTMFDLSPFERDVVLLCAGMELDARFASACAAAHGDPARPYPTFGLALAVFPGAHWSALTPAAPLRRWRLVELGADPSLTRSPLRLDERILHFLAGINTPDERLVGYITPIRTGDDLAPSHQSLVDRIAAIWPAAANGGTIPVVHLRGRDGAAMRPIATSVAGSLGMVASVLQSGDIPTGGVELDGLIRLWEREAALATSILLLDCGDLDEHEPSRAGLVDRFLARTGSGVIVGSRDRRIDPGRPVLTFDVDRPKPAEQRGLWLGALGQMDANGHGGYGDGRVDALVTQFNLGATAIRSAAVAARLAEPADLDAALWDACRVQARPELDGLARRIEPNATWHDLVLPAEQMRVLREIAIHVRRRAQVYERWGFGRQGTRGLGISALFAGSSGTGKTLAAEVIAADLHLDLYQIDLSQVVSKYIGETEKNLRRVFDAAEAGGAVLLFDEADALFGKRSEVKDSHDRYANIEVSYLLQRMEAYRGLAILTTNLKSALDTAFLRRIRFVVNFPFPDDAQRAEIWRRIFPAETPVADLDWTRLSRLTVAGGNIRNIALHGAFLAADAGSPVSMSHLLQAARGEYAKLEKPLTTAEIGGWV